MIRFWHTHATYPCDIVDIVVSLAYTRT
jgi:hypothetical protein